MHEPPISIFYHMVSLADLDLLKVKVCGASLHLPTELLQKLVEKHATMMNAC